MKELNKDRLKSISGGGWCAAGASPDGLSYAVTDDIIDQLEGLGYNINISSRTINPKFRKRNMGAVEITDANGNGIGDERMENLFGAPVQI